MAEECEFYYYDRDYCCRLLKNIATRNMCLIQIGCIGIAGDIITMSAHIIRTSLIWDLHLADVSFRLHVSLQRAYRITVMS